MLARLFNWLSLRSLDAPAAPLTVDPSPRRPIAVPERPRLLESPETPASLKPERLRGHIREQLAIELDKAGETSPPDLAFLRNLRRVADEQALCLPPFPAAAKEVQQILQEAQPRTLDLVLVIESDPGLLSRVWSRSGGAGFREPPTRVDQAIARIGLDEVWRIAWKTCMEGLAFDAPGFAQESAKVLLHGRVVGQVMARRTGDRKGAPYLAGLLHDVGKLVVYRSANNNTNPALVARIAAEQHPAFGALLASIWGLAPEVVEAIGTHHKAPAPSAELARQLRIVDLAAECAEQSLAPVDAEAEVLAIDPRIDFAALLADVAGAFDADEQSSNRSALAKPPPKLTLTVHPAQR